MEEPQEMSMRALRSGVWTSAAVAAVMSSLRPHWTPGFLGGAALSLFSLFSLRLCVRWMFRPGASQSVRALLGLVLFFKLPIYAVGLYYATRLTGCTPGGVLATAAGAGLMPAVIVMRTLGDMMVRPAVAKAASPVPSAIEGRIRVPALPSPGTEAASSGARSPQTAMYSYGEGAG